MGQLAFTSWLRRPFRPRRRLASTSSKYDPPSPPSPAPTVPDYPPSITSSASASSSIPYHSHPPPADVAFLSGTPPPAPRALRRARRAAAAADARFRRAPDIPTAPSPASSITDSGSHLYPRHHSTPYQISHQDQPLTVDFAALQACATAAATRVELSAGVEPAPRSFGTAPPTTPAAPPLDSFVPYRPPAAHQRGVPIALSGLAADFDDHVPVPVQYSYGGPPSADDPEPPERGERRGRYATGPGGRFAFRRRERGDAALRGTGVLGIPDQQQDIEQRAQEQPEYFGTSQHDDHDASDVGQGEEVLLRFLRNALGPKAHNLAVRLMNKTPITSSVAFSYVIHQATEDSDLDIIRRDLTAGRLYQSGVRLIGGAWCNLLLGDRFTSGSSTRQRHELTYRRSSCSCILCRVRLSELVRAQGNGRFTEHVSETESNGLSADVLSSMSSSSRTPTHSAMANFVVKCKLPSSSALMSIGASSSSRELEIGSVVRLNYRASAKLKFTEDVRELFGHFAYTGPISHEEVYRRVTTIGVHYYLYNKGKKERKVYIQGELIRLPVQVGVVKLGTQPMYFDELGATFCLHRKQIMSIYVGEIVLEGNSLGSFIKTGIRYYIGFGEERGVCPVFPNKTLGKARKLGINELLLHHHMVDDLEVRCL